MQMQMQIPGVLILSCDTKYGNVKGRRVMHKFVPDNPELLHFLVPYEMKIIPFSKVFVDKFCVIEPNIGVVGKHPTGKLIMVIGDVTCLDSFYKYRTLCRGLAHSLTKLQKLCKDYIRQNGGERKCIQTLENMEYVKRRTNQADNQIFTIDPLGCKDYDDAFAIAHDGTSHTVRIYISNVPLVLDTFGLWEELSKRVATIYLPTSKLPMLPTCLSEGICSLQCGATRVAMCMEILIVGGTILSVNIVPACTINVYKNYVYEEQLLLKDENYEMLYEVTKHVHAVHPYQSEIKDSHDVVSFWMIAMNHRCAEMLKNINEGICRVQVQAESILLPEAIKEFAHVFESAAALSCDIKTTETTFHASLCLDIYCNVTSPIRRVTDALNMIVLCKDILSENATIYYVKVIAEIARINSETTQISKLQNECFLLHLCENSDKDTLYSAYIVSVQPYRIYIPIIKYMGKLYSSAEHMIYDHISVRLFVFTCETSLSRKIRFKMVNS